jgi:hypothetical protein
MDFRFLTLTEFNSILKKATELGNYEDYDSVSDESIDLVTKVLREIRREVYFHCELYLNSVENNSTQVDESSLPFYPHPTPSDALPSFPASSEDSSTKDYSILVYFLSSGFVIGSCTLVYMVVNHFFVPLPPVEGMLDPSILSALSSSPFLPAEVSTPESGINDYLPSRTATLIITIVVVATL